MWLLESADNEDKQKHHLLLGVEFTVGRKGCNLNIDDRSVSRKHAILIATMADTSSSTDRPLLHLKDISSFGTRINKKKAESNVSNSLKDGDKIIFGSIKSAFWVRFSPLVVTSSCLEKSLKVELEQTMKTLGGKVVAEWGPSCTHLVMQNLSITVKVICALAAQRSVVTVDYFKTLIESIRNVDVPSPEESKFLPKVSDSLAVRRTSTFQSNIQRKSLFNGKTFIFLNASQLKKMHEAIHLAGGTVKLHTEKNDDISDQDLVAEGNIIMTPPPSGISKQLVSHIQAVLESYGKRMITDAEVGHAVLSCNIQQYCNPNADPGKPLDHLASQTMRTQTQDVFNSSTQSSMSLILNRSSKNIFNESKSDAAPSLSHHEDVSLAKKTSEPTEKNTIEPVSKKRRRDSVEAFGLEEDCNEDVSRKKQCVFKIPFSEDSLSSTRKSTSATESEQTVVCPKPSIVVADSDPEDEEPKSPFNTSESSKPENSATCSKKSLSLFVEDTNNLDDKDSEENNLGLPPKIQVQETPSTSSSSLLEKQKPFLVVEDSEIAEQSTSKKEAIVQVKKEIIDPTFEKAMQQTKTLFQEPMTEVIKEESQLENSSKKDVSRKNTQRQALADINLPEGFLTTRLPIKNQVTKIKREDDPEDKELPQGCVETVFTSLVTKKSSRPPPNPGITSSSEAPEGYKYYRGELVRNFKKFKKNALPTGFSLPRIIGGSDLASHVTSRSKEIDEWMRQTKEQESQQNEDERRAEELFNWDSSNRRKRTR